MKIFIPSYKRAGKVKTNKTIGGGILAIHEFEAEDYKKKEGGELFILPDKLRGNIAKVRNYILENADDDETVMMDDDISEIGFHENMKQIPMMPKKIIQFLQSGYQMAKDLKVSLWGVNLQSDPKFYREYSPFSLLSPILGTFSCHYKPKQRYDENLFLNEDYDFFLKTINEYRKTLRFNKYYYIADHLGKQGGCGAYRLKDFEIQQAEKMIKRWGSKVFKFDITKSTNGKLYIPIRGI
jgi:hypothetical protein|tara:strand:- start:45 stop:761 length:717 start_codon:yes stop_codon:yes gene_type:complete